jgi:hypothetical protein
MKNIAFSVKVTQDSENHKKLIKPISFLMFVTETTGCLDAILASLLPLFASLAYWM